MTATIVKALLTAAFIVLLSELAKRSTFLSALLIALPLATALTVVWLYLDTQDGGLAARYAWSVLLLTPPGMVFLAALPLLNRGGVNFWLSLLIATAITGIAYYGYTILLRRVFGVSL